MCFTSAANTIPTSWCPSYENGDADCCERSLTLASRDGKTAPFSEGVDYRRRKSCLAWFSVPMIDLTAELLWGKWSYKDSNYGTARQIQVGAKYLS